jgi:hypothetical protein
MTGVIDGIPGLVAVTPVPGSRGVGVKVGAIEFGVGIWGIGLMPPTPSSTEPIGTPMRPVAVEAIPVGDDADAAGLLAAAPMPAQVPDAVPAATPPPSKSEPAVPLDPIAALGTPFNPPLKLPAAELIPIHVAMLLVVGGVTGDVPDVAGLIPIEPSSVVPRGIPVRGTCAAGPIPSGDVIPSGDGALPFIWACAEPHRKSPASAPVKMRIMITASSKQMWS